MQRALQTYTFAALALLVAACGGSGGSASTASGGSTASTGTAGSATTSGTGAGPTAMAACTAQANAVCALRETCGPNFEIERLYGTAALCESRTAQVCVNAIDAKGTGNTTAAIEACATAYPTEMCTDFYDTNPVAACVPKAGSLATGAACGASAQCASTYCAVTQYAVCGTCQPLPAAGASCEVQADCGRDLACAIPTAASLDGGAATSGVCAAWVPSGGTCLTGVNPCQAGSVCVGDAPATATPGTCQTTGATVGATCDTIRKTGATCNADLGLVCIPSAKGSTTGTCQTITLAAAGAPCGDIGAAPITGFAECKNGGLCKKAVSSDTTGTCVATAADGMPCDNDPANGPPCLTPAKCVPPTGSSGTAGTCTVPNASTCM